LDSFLLNRTRCENIPARLAEEYPVTAIRIEHLVERGSTDDLFVRLAVLWALRHGTAGDEDYIWHGLLVQFFKFFGDEFRKGVCRYFAYLELRDDLLRGASRAILNLFSPYLSGVTHNVIA
jgi:hypothetical protein